MQAGARDVVHHSDTAALTAALDPGPPAVRGPARPRRRDAHEQGDLGVLAQGRRRQDHDRGQPRAGADRQGRPPGLPGRPRPRLRRRRDHHAAVPDALDRAGHRLGGLARRRRCSTGCSPGTRTRSWCWPLPATPTPASGSPRCWSSRIIRTLRGDVRLHRRRHRRRPSTSRSSPRSTRPTRCVLVATLDVPTLKNVKVAVETLDAAQHRRGPPAPGAQPRRRRGRHQRRQGRGDPRHDRRHADRQLARDRGGHQRRQPGDRRATPTTSSARPSATWQRPWPASSSAVAGAPESSTPQSEAEAKSRRSRRRK